MQLNVLGNYWMFFKDNMYCKDNLLQLKIPKPTTVRLNFNHIITVCSVEVTLFEIVLDCKKLQISWVPPCLSIFQACGSHLDNAAESCTIFLV